MESVAVERMREKTLIEADARYRVHVEVMPDHVWVALYDLQTAALHGKEVWRRAIPRPADKTAADALAAAVRALLKTLEAGLN